MAEAIFRHFFLGDDSYSSQREVAAWEQLYCRKHGESSRYVLDGSEQELTEQLLFLNQHAASSSLFGGCTLLLIKRICSKATPAAPERKHLERMLTVLNKIPDGTTVLWWEPFAFAVDHPIMQAARSRVHLAELPAPSHVVRFASNILSKYRQSLTPSAQTWLRQQYLLHTQVKKGATDQCSWWLHSLLEGASIRGGEVITEDDLHVATDSVGVVPDPFPLTAAIADQRFVDAYRLAHEFGQGAESSQYFGLFGALAWQINRKPGRLNREQIRHAMWLLGEVEIASKLGDFPMEWLLLRFIRAMQTSGEVIRPRVLWLATLPV